MTNSACLLLPVFICYVKTAIQFNRNIILFQQNRRIALKAEN